MPTQTSAAYDAANAYRTLGTYARSFDVPVDAVVTAGTDDLKCLVVKAGETVLDVMVTPIGDMDTGAAALRFEVGDSAASDTYVAAFDPGAGTGAVFRADANLGKQYTADDYILLTAAIAATTPAAGTVRVTVLLQAA